MDVSVQVVVNIAATFQSPECEATARRRDRSIHSASVGFGNHKQT
jgi:hypothetical protein